MASLTSTIRRAYFIARWAMRKPRLPNVIRDVRAYSLTYLDDGALNDIYEAVTTLERNHAEGILVEAGCALGGSAIVAAAAKSKARPFYVFDVFGMIPAPSEKDGQDVHERYELIREKKSKGIGGRKYYGYEDNLLEKVVNNFSRLGLPVAENNVHLVKGLFQDTLDPREPVAYAHIDGDWYESVMTCLRKIAPKLISGGVIVVDDYHCWSGCRTAVDEYFSGRRDEFDFVERSRLQIVRR